MRRRRIRRNRKQRKVARREMRRRRRVRTGRERGRNTTRRSIVTRSETNTGIEKSGSLKMVRITEYLNLSIMWRGRNVSPLLACLTMLDTGLAWSWLRKLVVVSLIIMGRGEMGTEVVSLIIMGRGEM